VLAVLSRAGVAASEVQAEAQEVWLTVYRRLLAGEGEPESWPAYLTALARGRAANHRRAAGLRRVAPLEAAHGAAAPFLSPERMVVLVGLIDALPNPGQREAVLLRVQGYSVKEIAERQGISEAGVRRRLQAAEERLEKELERDEEDRKKRSNAFWGFGSFEALIDALSKERERQWRGIEDAIREIEVPPETPPSGPKRAAPLVTPLPLIPGVPPRLVPALAKGAVIATFGAAVVVGASLGVSSGGEREAVPIVACPDVVETAVSAPPENAPPPRGAPAPQAATSEAPAAVRPAFSSPSVAARAVSRPAARPVSAADDLEDLLLREQEDRTGARPSPPRPR
jgi:RNA polymerase sigma factor (sigma-70 family)